MKCKVFLSLMFLVVSMLENKMRSRSMFHTLGVLILPLLIFGMSSVTLAQQNSVQTGGAEITAAEDVKTVRLTAKAAAEQDANSDVNRLLWFGAGMGIASIGSTVGAGIGCIVGSMINSEGNDLLILPNTAQVAGILIGGSVGCLAPLIGIHNSSSVNPPPERLLGKSPEYVKFYTDAYGKKARLIRIQSAVAGAGACGGALLVGFLL